MYYVYVIKSLNHEKYYTGHTNNIERRLKEHNIGKTKSIKSFAPFELVYFEKFSNREDAIGREKYLKSGSGREFLKTIR